MVWHSERTRLELKIRVFRLHESGDPAWRIAEQTGYTTRHVERILAGPPLKPPTRPDWSSALCAQVDPEIFFPSRGDSRITVTAKQVCGRCPIQCECLEWALEPGQSDLYGVWGGATPRERQKLRRNSRRQSC